MTNDIIKKGFDAAEKEHQEKEIQKIKKIVQTYLEKIQEKSEQKDKLDEEIRLLKKDLDDLKAGRIDKIKERQDKDERARDISIIVIQEIKEKYIPYQPWYSPWIISLKDTWTVYNNNTITIPTVSITNSATSNTVSGSATYYYSNCEMPTDCSYTVQATGNTISSFVPGSYEVKGKIINL